MSIASLKASLPDYARDLKQNLSNLLTAAALTPQQLAGTFVASALATRQETVTRAILAEFGPKLSAAAMEAAKAAAAVTTMYNTFYRFIHLASAQDYRALPDKLRTNAIARPGVDEADFELWSLAVSAQIGSGVCIDAHEREARRAGLSAEAIYAAVCIAAVVHAAAAVLDGEAALTACSELHAAAG